MKLDRSRQAEGGGSTEYTIPLFQFRGIRRVITIQHRHPMKAFTHTDIAVPSDLSSIDTVQGQIQREFAEVIPGTTFTTSAMNPIKLSRAQTRLIKKTAGRPQNE